MEYIYFLLVYPILKKSFRYSIQEVYLAIRFDLQYILFQLSTDIMARQMANLSHRFPLYTAETSNSYNYAHSFHSRQRKNK